MYQCRLVNATVVIASPVRTFRLGLTKEESHFILRYVTIVM